MPALVLVWVLVMVMVMLLVMVTLLVMVMLLVLVLASPRPSFIWCHTHNPPLSTCTNLTDDDNPPLAILGLENTSKGCHFANIIAMHWIGLVKSPAGWSFGEKQSYFFSDKTRQKAIKK